MSDGSKHMLCFTSLLKSTPFAFVVTDRKEQRKIHAISPRGRPSDLPRRNYQLRASGLPPAAARQPVSLAGGADRLVRRIPCGGSSPVLLPLFGDTTIRRSAGSPSSFRRCTIHWDRGFRRHGHSTATRMSAISGTSCWSAGRRRRRTNCNNCAENTRRD